MRFISFVSDKGNPALGVRIDATHIADITAAGGPSTLDEVLAQGDAGMREARNALASPQIVRNVQNLQFLPPVTHPGKALAIGLNYLDHAAESNFEAPKLPVVFHRYPSSWVAHEVPLCMPRLSQHYDYEAELVAVIGKAGRYISKDAALDHVAGYSLFNDGSVRDYQMRTHQWMMGKNFDASGAFGPEFVTADELPPRRQGAADPMPLERTNCPRRQHPRHDLRCGDPDLALLRGHDIEPR